MGLRQGPRARGGCHTDTGLPRGRLEPTRATAGPVGHEPRPERHGTVMPKNHTWHGMPRSATIGIVGRGDKLYLHARSGARHRGHRALPERQVDKYWTQNVSRDPRVRLKIEDKIYEATVALMTDRDEVAGRNGKRSRNDRAPARRTGARHGRHAQLARVPPERPGRLSRFAGSCILRAARRLRSAAVGRSPLCSVRPAGNTPCQVAHTSNAISEDRVCRPSSAQFDFADAQRVGQEEDERGCGSARWLNRR